MHIRKFNDRSRESQVEYLDSCGRATENENDGQAKIARLNGLNFPPSPTYIVEN